MKKEEFKEFVKKNPKLISYVKSNEMSWQKFYELYDLYGEDENIWKDYLKTNEDVEKIATTTTTFAFADFINWLKNIDLDGLQEGIGNVQRVLGVVQDLSNKNNNVEEKPKYKPRPLYKHFED